MTERERLLDRLTALERDRQPGAVATVVQVAGSSYRRAGARMLFGADGERVGVLSGGCFDLDDRARQAMRTGRPSRHRYDTTAPADVVIGSGSGCQGVVDILVAPVDDGHRPPLRECLEPPLRQGLPAALATVIDPPAADPELAPLGARLLVTGDGPARGSLGDAVLDLAVERRARSLLGSERVTVDRYPVGRYPAGRGTAQVMIEGFMPVRRLAVFGAGEDAAPLAVIGAQAGLSVVLIDHRPAYANPQRHPAADAVLHAADAADAVRRIAPGPRTACVSVTHDFLRDAAILAALRETPAAYVGVIGPRSRAERLIAEAGWAEAGWDADEPGRLYCPAGLDIGAQTPEEIALSVVAEILGVLSARTAGHLRDRAGPIHDRSP